MIILEKYLSTNESLIAKDMRDNFCNDFGINSYNCEENMNEQEVNDVNYVDEEVFSWDKLSERFGGDEEIIAEVIPIFLRDNKERMENLQKAIANDDLKEINEKALKNELDERKTKADVQVKGA